jgi:hypothetical protein
MAIFKDYFQLRGVLNTSVMDALLHNPRSYTIPENELMRKPILKLILVSKQWCLLCLPRLYEHVTIFHLKALKALASALDIGSATSNISGRSMSYSPKIRRIDIMPNSPQNWRADHIEDFSTIHSLCPNLEIFCDVSGKSTPLSLLLVVLGFAEHNAIDRKPLRHIRWALGSSSWLSYIMPRIEKLGTIEVIIVDFGECRDVNFEDELSLPRLHTLQIQGTAGDAHKISRFLGRVSLWEIPALNRLILGKGFAWINAGFPFFETHGAKIKYLDVTRISTEDMFFPDPMVVSDFLLPCVNLVNLVVDCDVSPEEFPPSLSRVTIRTYMEHFPASNDLPLWYIRAMRSIGEIIRHVLKVPDRRLSSVRLLKFQWNMLEEPHWALLDLWKGWVQKLESRGVRLEDELGRTMSI